jgi:dUTPase
MKIYVKKVDGVVLPQKGSELAAGYDIVATSDPKIVGQKYTPVGMEPSEQGNLWNSVDYIEYETNLFIAPTTVTFHTLIHPRSSVSKYNLVLANSIGLIDNDYRGMVICRFKYIWQPEDFRLNTNNLFNGIINMDKLYKKGDKIAQLVAEPTVQIEWEFVDDLNKTQRGEGGFGSTDLQKQSSEFPKGKTLMEVFAESGGGGAPVPYSEQIKKRDIL